MRKTRTHGIGMFRTVRARRWFLQTALAYLGTPYRWGGDDPSGFDCSGLVVECLKTAGIISERADYTADGLARLYSDRRISQPRRGALLFTFNPDGRATHVAVCLDRHFQISASGGTRHTSNPDAAWRDNAYVRIRPIRFDPTRMKVADPLGRWWQWWSGDRVKT